MWKDFVKQAKRNPLQTTVFMFVIGLASYFLISVIIMGGLGLWIFFGKLAALFIICWLVVSFITK